MHVQFDLPVALSGLAATHSRMDEGAKPPGRQDTKFTKGALFFLATL